MSSTAKTSRSSALTLAWASSILTSSVFSSVFSSSFSAFDSFGSSPSFCSLSASFFSSFPAPFFSDSAFFCSAAGAFLLDAPLLKSCCFFFQALSSRVHSDICVLNHSEIFKSSTRWVNFLLDIHRAMYSLHAASGCHAYLISSKPSSLVGKLNCMYVDAITFKVKSVEPCCRNFISFSASVSSTLTSSSASSASAFSSSSSIFTSSSSLTSSLASSFALPSSPSSSFASLASLASLACFAASWRFFCSASRFRFASSAALVLAASAFFRFASASAFACLSFSTLAWTQLVYSAGGSPTTTLATRLSSLLQNLSSTFFRESASKLPFTSMTT
mmetsp:Transcript_58595/g.178694  ORF Transcript_58595/g.178694 Transcript_58595/m.178694 type:complete len:332 (+) Transcript_58595:652-1647(+)